MSGRGISGTAAKKEEKSPWSTVPIDSVKKKVPAAAVVAPVVTPAEIVAFDGWKYDSKTNGSDAPLAVSSARVVALQAWLKAVPATPAALIAGEEGTKRRRAASASEPGSTLTTSSSTTGSGSASNNWILGLGADVWSAILSHLLTDGLYSTMVTCHPLYRLVRVESLWRVAAQYLPGRGLQPLIARRPNQGFRGYITQMMGGYWQRDVVQTEIKKRGPYPAKAKQIVKQKAPPVPQEPELGPDGLPKKLKKGKKARLAAEAAAQRNERPNGSWYAASNRGHYLSKLALADMHADVYLPEHDPIRLPRFMASIRRTIDRMFPPPEANAHGRRAGHQNSMSIHSDALVWMHQWMGTFLHEIIMLLPGVRWPWQRQARSARDGFAQRAADYDTKENVTKRNKVLDEIKRSNAFSVLNGDRTGESCIKYLTGRWTIGDEQTQPLDASIHALLAPLAKVGVTDDQWKNAASAAHLTDAQKEVIGRTHSGLLAAAQSVTPKLAKLATVDQSAHVITLADIEAIVHVILPVQLGQHARNDARQAVIRFNTSVNAAVKASATPTDYDTLAHEYMIRGASESEPRARRAAFLNFLPSPIYTLLRTRLSFRVHPAVAIYIAGILEYICSEVCELGGRVARDSQSHARLLGHKVIARAVELDTDLRALFISRATVSIHDWTLRPRNVLGGAWQQSQLLPLQRPVSAKSLAFPQVIDLSLAEYICRTLDYLLMAGPANARLKVVEDQWRRDYYRAYYAKSSAGAIVAKPDPSVILLDVHDSATFRSFTHQRPAMALYPATPLATPLVADEAAAKVDALLTSLPVGTTAARYGIPTLLSRLQRHERALGAPAIASRDSFLANWKKLTCNVFKDFDWKNIIVAGGSVGNCLQPYYEDKLARLNDFDFFVYGLDQDGAQKKLKYMVEYLAKYGIPGRNKETRDDTDTLGMRTQHSVTLYCKFVDPESKEKEKGRAAHQRRDVQIVLRAYHDPAEVLLGFDVDSCCVAFDGNKVVCLPRWRRAITQGFNLVDESRRSTTYERRLTKYAHRGYGVAVPGLSAAAAGIISPLLWHGKHARGTQTGHSGCVCTLMKMDLKASVSTQPRPNPLWAHHEWYMGWNRHATWYVKHFDHPNGLAESMSIGDYDLKLSTERTNYGSGVYTMLDGSTFFTATSIEQLLNGMGPMGAVKFVDDQPGRQLLSGSFHPVSDDNWDHGVCTRPLLKQWRGTSQAKTTEIASMSSTSEAYDRAASLLSPLSISADDSKIIFDSIATRLPSIVDKAVTDSIASAMSPSARTIASYASARALVAFDDASLATVDDDSKLEALLDEAQALLDRHPVPAAPAGRLPGQVNHTVRAQELPAETPEEVEAKNAASSAAKVPLPTSTGFGGRAARSKNHGSEAIADLRKCVKCSTHWQMTGVLAYCVECARYFCRNCLAPPTESKPYVAAPPHAHIDRIVALTTGDATIPLGFTTTGMIAAVHVPAPPATPTWGTSAPAAAVVPNLAAAGIPNGECKYIDLVKPVPADLAGLMARMRTITLPETTTPAGALEGHNRYGGPDDGEEKKKDARVRAALPAPTIDHVASSTVDRDASSVRSSAGVVAQFNRAHPYGREIVDQNINVLFSHFISDLAVLKALPTVGTTASQSVIALQAIQIVSIASTMATRLTPMLTTLLNQSAPNRTTGNSVGAIWSELGLDSPSALIAYIINIILDRISSAPERTARRDAHTLQARIERFKRQRKLMDAMSAAIVVHDIYDVLPVGGNHGEKREGRNMHLLWQSAAQLIPKLPVSAEQKEAAEKKAKEDAGSAASTPAKRMIGRGRVKGESVDPEVARQLTNLLSSRMDDVITKRNLTY